MRSETLANLTALPDHAIDALRAALDGIYTIRTTIPATQMDPAQVVDTYKNLSRVEREIRSLKSIDLDLRQFHTSMRGAKKTLGYKTPATILQATVATTP